MGYSFRTTRVTARPVEKHDARDIRNIFAANAALLKLLDREHDPYILADRFVLRLNLPPDGEQKHLFNSVLHGSGTQCAIGLLSLYEGYPAPHIAYIGQLFLHPRVHGQGFGRETYLQVENMLRQKPLDAVRVGVALRNWNALRFWARQGFLCITGISGDRHFAPEAHAFLELQKKL